MNLLLLDTHVWLWNVEGDARRIGRRTRRLMARAEAAGELRLSSVSLFELVALHAAGRLRLAHPPELWIRRALESTGAAIAEVSADTAIDAGALPREAVPDPLDRLLVATARQLDATLVTCDRRLIAYADATRNVRVCDGGA